MKLKTTLSFAAFACACLFGGAVHAGEMLCVGSTFEQAHKCTFPTPAEYQGDYANLEQLRSLNVIDGVYVRRIINGHPEKQVTFLATDQALKPGDRVELQVVQPGFLLKEELYYEWGWNRK